MYSILSGWSLVWMIQAASMKLSSMNPHLCQVSDFTLTTHICCAQLSAEHQLSFISSTSPAKHYDVDTTEPISSGLQTLDELLSWRRSDANPFNVAVVPLAPREPSLANSPRRTLVSHDMMGGYLDDRYGGIWRTK